MQQESNLDAKAQTFGVWEERTLRFKDSRDISVYETELRQAVKSKDKFFFFEKSLMYVIRQTQNQVSEKAYKCLGDKLCEPIEK